LPINSSDLP